MRDDAQGCHHGFGYLDTLLVRFHDAVSFDLETCLCHRAAHHRQHEFERAQGLGSPIDRNGAKETMLNGVPF